MREVSAGRPVPRGWLRLAWRRALSEWAYKAFGTAGFIALFFVGYFWIADHPAFTVTVMPFTTLDRLIGFHPWALAPYVTLWLYISLSSALIGSRRELFSFAWAAAVLSLVGMAVFYFWPSETPKPDVNWALYPAFSFLQSPSMARNACPSLHAAFAIFCGVWIERSLRQMRSGPWLRLFNLFWCLAILYSTLATKQHVAVDLYAGVGLGVVVAAVNLRFLAAAPVRIKRPEHGV